MATAKIETGPGKIYEKILEIRKALPVLAKNGVGPQTQGSYKFLSIDDILEKVKPLEDEHGVISYPVDHQVTFHYNTAADKGDGRVPKENVQALTDYVFRYVAVEDGSFIDVSVPGEGIDSQDKGTRKATTQAQKIANILLYNIITGEPDPDAQDGGADAQAVSNGPAAKKPAAQRRVEQAQEKAAQSKPGGADLNALKAQIRAAIDGGKVEKDAVNDTMKALQGEGLKGVPLHQRLIKDLGIGD